MRGYMLRRLAQSALTLVLATMVVFAGVRALPGDPALALAGEERDPASLEAVREQYGLNDPVWVQYLHYLQNFLQGDLGRSVRTNIPVRDLLVSALPVTLELSVLALLVASLVGVLTGILAAVRRGKPAEWLANGFALLGLSVPNFWLGLMAILYLSVALGLFPASGHVPFSEDPLANLHHMVLPAVILGIGLAAVIMRQTRSSMIESMSTDYIRTARAKGLIEKLVINRHALKNALLPVVTVIGIEFAFLIGGLVVTEQVFNLNGIGRLFVQAVQNQDYTLSQALVMLTVIIFVICNLIVDLLYGWLDPRIRFS